MQIGWHKTDYIVQEFEELRYFDRYYLWRKQGATSNSKEENSWESVIEYFDDWLAKDGWVRFDGLEYFDPCRSHLPEANFLPQGVNGYVAYRRPESVVFRSEPTVCLAAWNPLLSNHYKIVLITINPSLLTGLGSAIDLAGAPTLDLAKTPTSE
jgi:hypothetical protein